ncbi:MAG: glycosyltransferase family 9 protein [Verrucomicrobiales bacterium]|nr:glycosyltransferase family 9 protein [Verrucomicrobiales bacterium]
MLVRALASAVSTVPPTPGSRLIHAGIRRLLVVDLGFLGDTIHLLPALAELRRHQPGTELHVVTTPLGAEVLRLTAWVDRVWEYPLGNPSPPWWRHLGLQWELRRQHFEAAFNFSGADRTLFVTAAAGIPLRITRQPNRGSWWRRQLAGRILPPPSRAQPVFEQRRELLARAGYELGTVDFGLCLPPADLAWAAAEIGGQAVHLSINASSPFKEWPMDRWVDFTRQLLREYSGCVVATGSTQPREQLRLTELQQRVGDPRLKVPRAPLSLARLAALVQHCTVHVGTDSGVTHLAVALGTPTVSVFRDYAGLVEWRPRGPRDSAAIRPCRCVDRPAMDPACVAAGTAGCLAEIPAGEILALVRNILGSGTEGSTGGSRGVTPA